MHFNRSVNFEVWLSLIFDKQKRGCNCRKFIVQFALTNRTESNIFKDTGLVLQVYRQRIYARLKNLNAAIQNIRQSKPLQK